MTKDIEIQKNVMEELNSIPFINANEIGVSVKDGIVSLSGLIDSYPKKIAIERAVKKLNGVKAVAEEIIVNLNEKHKKTDSEIAHMVINVIEWNVHPIHNLKVLVEDGCVTLEGSVDWDYQRKSLTQVLGDTIGFGDDAYSILDGADILMIMTEWPVFRTPDFDVIASKLKYKAIFDGRNLYDAQQMIELGFHYESVGRMPVFINKNVDSIQN